MGTPKEKNPIEKEKGHKTYAFTLPPNYSFLSNDRIAAHEGIGEGTNKRESLRQPVLSVIIPAMNEERTIAAVVREAARICRDAEVLVIVNGSTDGTATIAEQAGARVLQYPEALGHDAGRRVGAAAARGQILLFTDADIPIPAEHLAPYVRAVVNGVDVALNDYNGPVKQSPVHPVIEAKYMLNSLLSRSDLGGASMTAIPHALSRQALEIIGISSLEIPPLAHAKAIFGGLRVQAVHHVPVGKWNAARPRKQGVPIRLAKLC